MKKMYSPALKDALAAIGIIMAFYGVLALLAFVI
jgi:hypothetical protein